jgi:cytochrome c2
MAAAPTSRRIFLKQIAASSGAGALAVASPAVAAPAAEPQKALPGNTMPFAGLSDPKQRAEIVDYLKTLK